ncbi:MAG: GPW/gp25 family protein [Cyanobacteria bacterium SBLK]|nr:GPW/gp25 family protein [Cyanobacteria bacterium SBLK]
MELDYIGSGLGDPLNVNPQGGLQLSSSERNLEESIYIILRTNIGERVYRPDFGSRLAELVFEPLNIDTLLKIRLYVEEAIERWEPRIILKSVSVEPDPARGSVEINIVYQPKNSLEPRSLVYPFYLQGDRDPEILEGELLDY